MEHVDFERADTYEPEDGWRRVAMAGSEAVSFEWFEKPPGHSSPMHEHDNEQVCLCVSGELTVHTEAESAILGRFDSVRLRGGESHRVENTGTEPAISIDAFVPGRSFDF